MGTTARPGPRRSRPSGRPASSTPARCVSFAVSPPSDARPARPRRRRGHGGVRAGTGGRADRLTPRAGPAGSRRPTREPGALEPRHGPRDRSVPRSGCRAASVDEIKRAYRRLAKAHHPDAAGPSALPRFLAIQAAYELLMGRAGPAPAGGPTRSVIGSTVAADPDRANATHQAYGGRTRRARPAWSAPAPGPAAATREESGPTAGTPTRDRGKATLGSTSYDDADTDPFEPDWGGAIWYGPTSGTYWTSTRASTPILESTGRSTRPGPVARRGAARRRRWIGRHAGTRSLGPTGRRRTASGAGRPDDRPGRRAGRRADLDRVQVGVDRRLRRPNVRAVPQRRGSASRTDSASAGAPRPRTTASRNRRGG